MSDFSVQGTQFSYVSSGEVATLHIMSSPRDYRVDFTSDMSIEESLRELFSDLTDPIVLCDQNVFNSHVESSSVVTQHPTLYVDASESFKSIDGVLTVLDFIEYTASGKRFDCCRLRGRNSSGRWCICVRRIQARSSLGVRAHNSLSANRQLYRFKECFELSGCEESRWNVLCTTKSNGQFKLSQDTSAVRDRLWIGRSLSPLNHWWS